MFGAICSRYNRRRRTVAWTHGTWRGAAELAVSFWQQANKAMRNNRQQLPHIYIRMYVFVGDWAVVYTTITNVFVISLIFHSGRAATCCLPLWVKQELLIRYTLDITVYLRNKAATGKKRRKSIRYTYMYKKTSNPSVPNADRPHQKYSPSALGYPESADWDQ